MLYAIDFGTGNALAIHGPDGPVSRKQLKIPKVKGGKTPAMELLLVLDALVRLGANSIVFEAPTVGSSGAAKEDIFNWVEQHPTVRLCTLSARAVKNYRMDHKIPNPKTYGTYKTPENKESAEGAHVLDAEILYRIATSAPERLHDVQPTESVAREFTTVRPMDKQLYRGHTADTFMSVLPNVADVGEEFAFLIDPKTKDWRRSLVMPFAMAMQEPFWQTKPFDDQRDAFLKIGGIYDAGYPSFYRRAFAAWVIERAARQGLKLRDQSEEFRKEQQKVCRHVWKKLFHLCRAKMQAA